MRELVFIALVALTALSCFTAPSKVVHRPDARADATGPDAATNDGLGPSDGAVTRDADAAEGTTDAPDTPGIPPGTLRHVGWFGPGGGVTGTGLTGLGSLSGPRQGWLVK